MKKKTNEEFLEEIKELNPTYDVLSEYVNIDTNVFCHCNVHDIDFYSTPYNLLKGRCGCELCRREKIGNKHRRTKEEFINKLIEVNPNIEVVGEYTQCKNKIECRCKIHNEIFFITPDHLIQGKTGCKKCIDIKYHEGGLKSHEDFINQVKNINDKVNIVGIYTGSRQKIETECLNCGNVWFPEATSLLCGYGCPKCSSSRGEKRIQKFLESYGIVFEPQKKFSNLLGVGGRHLSYDFYLPKFNLLIEYQGQFHDGTAPQQTEEEFSIQKEHDRRKSIYAKDNDIELLEIWYWDYNNIERILNNVLNNLETP